MKTWIILPKRGGLAGPGSVVVEADYFVLSDSGHLKFHKSESPSLAAVVAPGDWHSCLEAATPLNPPMGPGETDA